MASPESLWEEVGQTVSSDEMEPVEEAAAPSTHRKGVRQTTKLRRPTTSPTTRTQAARLQAANNVQLAQMQEMQAQMQQMFQQMQQMSDEVPVSGSKSGSNKQQVNKQGTSTSGSRTKTARQGALTNPTAPFPTLSNVFSDDITFNMLRSLQAQTLTFKWKMLLLLMRVRNAVEADGRRRWKRNPRWILHMHGRHLASIWGHVGSARQLCFNPKVYPLAMGEMINLEDEEPERERRRSKSQGRSAR